jgi:hypothetical protein
VPIAVKDLCWTKGFATAARVPERHPLASPSPGRMT